MAYEQKELSGAVFKNNRKVTENDPNVTGTAKIGGVIYRIAGWTNKDKNGDPWMSLRFSVQEPREAKPIERESGNPESLASQLNDDIPF